MKTAKKSISVLLAAALSVGLLVTSAFAAWPVYGGNNNHNAVVTSAPTSTNPNITEINLPNNGSGWDGVDNVPVMRTAGSTTYAYVLYDGYTVKGANGGGRLAKINCNTGSVVWSKQVTTAAGFQLSTPLLVQGATEAEDVIYIGASSAAQVLEPMSAPVTVAAGSSETISQSGFSIASAATNRVALGIYLGTSPTTSATATVTWNLNGTIGSKTFTSSDILQDGTTGKYYFYLNENISAVNAAATNSITYTVSMTGASGTVEYAELYQQTAAVQKVTGLDSKDASGVSNIAVTAGTAISGQINTPVTTDGTYIYFGTWSGNSAGTYYQVKISDNSIKTFKPASYGFYWAGAVVKGDYVYFGSDNGTLYWRSVSDFSGTGGSLALPAVSGNAAGNVRSTVMLNGDKIYFTSQGSGKGNFYCYDVSGGTPTYSWGAVLGGTCTSTPVISTKGNIYVGFYGGFTTGGVQKVAAPSTTGTGAVGTATTIANTGPVQCTPVVCTIDEGRTTYDYIYFNTNSNTGAGYCIKVQSGTTVGTTVWQTEPDTYALGGMAIENGYAVFGNDYDHLYVVK